MSVFTFFGSSTDCSVSFVKRVCWRTFDSASRRLNRIDLDLLGCSLTHFVDVGTHFCDTTLLNDFWLFVSLDLPDFTTAPDLAFTFRRMALLFVSAISSKCFFHRCARHND